MDITVQKQREKITWFSKIALIICFVLIFFTPTTHADDNSFQVYMVNEITSGIFDLITDTLKGEGDFGPLYAYMATGNPEEGAADFGTDFNAPYLVFKGVGALLCLSIALSHILKNTERGVDPVEAVFKTIVEVCIAGIFIMNLDSIMGWIMEFGGAIIETVTSSVPGADDPAAAASAEDLLLALTGARTGGMMWGVKTIAMLLIPWLGALIGKLAAKFILIQLLFEIGIRRAFAPIAVAQIYEDGLRGPGMKYLKKFLATFFKLAVCALVCFLTKQLTSRLLTATDFHAVGEVFNYFFTVIIIEFSTVGLMFKTGEYANDIVGA